MLCEHSAPALAELARESGIAVVAVYHPKPPREVRVKDVRAAARRIGMPGALAVDRDWAVLEKNWPAERRRFTSVSIVVDRDGKIRWLHGGGDLVKGSAEFEALRDVLATLR